MMQLILVVQLNRKVDYCTPINEKESLTVLKCMKELDINAHLEYDESPFECKVPEHFDWVQFIHVYKNSNIVKL